MPNGVDALNSSSPQGVGGYEIPVSEIIMPEKSNEYVAYSLKFDGSNIQKDDEVSILFVLDSSPEEYELIIYGNKYNSTYN